MPKTPPFVRVLLAADPDTREVLPTEIKTMRSGRPPVSVKRPRMSLRTDPDILEYLRRSGKGWQTRVNALLREAMEQGRV